VKVTPETAAVPASMLGADDCCAQVVSTPTDEPTAAAKVAASLAARGLVRGQRAVRRAGVLPHGRAEVVPVVALHVAAGWLRVDAELRLAGVRDHDVVRDPHGARRPVHADAAVRGVVDRLVGRVDVVVVDDERLVVVDGARVARVAVDPDPAGDAPDAVVGEADGAGDGRRRVVVVRDPGVDVGDVVVLDHGCREPDGDAGASAASWILFPATRALVQLT
jgi:hypothetical protein